MKSRNLLLTVLGVLFFIACTFPGAAAQNYTLSAAVSGLASGVNLKLEDNVGNELMFTSNETLTFASTYASGATYSVTIFKQPTGQTCTLGSNASGTITGDTTVAVTCASTTGYTLSAAVTGLTAGATLKLEDNVGNELQFTTNETLPFSSTYASGASYSVTIFSQPAGETCTLGSNASGTITGNTTVAVTCAPSATYTISVAVTGLTGTLVMQDSQSDTLTFTTNNTQTFAKSYTSGSTYTVTVKTQPSGQTCTLSSNATGTITSNITVTATCTTNSVDYTISVAVTGLTGTLVVQDSLSDTLTFTTNDTQTFATSYPSGSSYTVTVKTQPKGQSCTLSSNAKGTITKDITVTATCGYKISVAVTGLSGTLKLEDNKGAFLTFTSNKTETFSTVYTSGATYSVTVATQPAGQTCTLGSNSSGTITSNITVTATCTTNSANYTISVAVTGLTGTLVVQDSKSDQLTFTTNNTQTFATSYASGSTYSVTVQTQPAGQTCTLSSNASGTITSNITVTATCTTNVVNYTISVAVTGLTGTLVVQDSKSDQLTFTTNNTQTFATSYASGSTYSVTVQTQPAGQTCTLSSNASGTITSNITVTATCTTNVVNYTISVAVTGLTGTLVMQDSKSDQLTFTTNNTQTFATSYASGSTYTVTVKTQPAGQTCTLSSNASGTITSNITVTATCAASGSTISVSVTGLSGTVVMEDDKGDTLTFTSNNTQTFASSYTSGATYTVSVTNQPSTQSCVPTYMTGTISSNITIDANCATGATRQLGTISNVSSVTCQGYRFTQPASCQQMTVSCPNVPDVSVYLKTNTPTPSIGTVTWNTGTDGNGLYDSIFTDAAVYAIQPVLNAGFTTVEIDWGTPFNTNQPDGWVLGPGGTLAAACRYATVTQWIYTNIQNNTSLPYCATGNSGGAGALAYALSQYNSGSILSMAEVTSGPPAGRLDWGCGCQEGKLAVQCGTATTLGTCFGNADAPVWDPAYNPTASPGICTDAVNGTLPPGGLNFFLGDSVEAPGALYTFPTTFVNVVFGGADNSSAIPIGQDWLNNITTSKAQACVAGGEHSMANTIPGAQQIANDLISGCKLQ